MSLGEEGDIVPGDLNLFGSPIPQGLKQYLSLPHLFLLDSYWIPTNFLKMHFHIFFHFPQLDSYWTPTGFLLDSYWTPTELKQMSPTECNGSDTGFLLDSHWIPTGVSLLLT